MSERNLNFDLNIEDECVLIGLGNIRDKKDASKKAKHIQKEIDLCMINQGYKRK